MSGGTCCKCPESKKPMAERAWVVTQRRCNHSAFSGYHRTSSRYSAISCTACRALWRSTGLFVNMLKDAA